VAEDTQLPLPSLLGSYFHSDDDRGWQGWVIGEPHPGVFLVELFSWIDGSANGQKVVPIAEMSEWEFFDTSEEMRHAYENRVAPRREMGGQHG